MSLLQVRHHDQDRTRIARPSEQEPAEQ